MLFRFEFQSFDRLPPLAWCARAETGSPIVCVSHGPGVVTQAEFFVEGAWDGPYQEGALDRTCLLMGSGGMIADQQLLFATPCHPLERLHLVNDGQVLLVSNSLPFLLAEAKLALDAKYPNYKADFWSTVYGIDRYVKTIPTQQGVCVRLFCYSNVLVGPDLQVKESPKIAPPAWSCFAEYRAFLRNALAALCRNASAPQRRIAYDCLATLSTGYDSAAAAALGAEAGCINGVTFQKGTRYLGDGEEVEDSGRVIGQALGMRVREFSRSDYLQADPRCAAEFASCGDSADLQLAAFQQELPGKLFLTGFGGDIVWDRHNPNVTTTLLRQPPPNGDSLGEFRLRLGFLHVPLPYFGAVRHPEIHAISNAPEMSPWMLGNDYDRPIPRRIVEEKGVARQLFGQSKKGSFTAVHYGRRRIRRLVAFEDFYQRHRKQRPWLDRTWAELRYLAGKALVRGLHLARRLGLPQLFPQVTSWNFLAPGRPSFIVAWGNHELSQRYRQAVNG